MWMYVLVGCVGMFTAYFAYEYNDKPLMIQSTARDKALGKNMLIYRNAVLTYATANTGYTGVIADASLSLPTWYSKMTGVSNYAAAGKGYVYYVTSNGQGLSYNLTRQMNNSINAGIKDTATGKLFNPLFGLTAITLPAAIPNGAVVIAP